MEYYSAIKKKEIMPFAATWMQREIITLSKISQKDKYHIISLTCGIQNMTQMSLSMKQKQTHRPREQTCGCQGEGAGVSRCELFCIEWINKVLLYSTENCIQYPGINQNGEEYIKKIMYICITESLCCTAIMNRTL